VTNDLICWKCGELFDMPVVKVGDRFIAKPRTVCDKCLKILEAKGRDEPYEKLKRRRAAEKAAQKDADKKLIKEKKEEGKSRVQYSR
jgi:hypothetical protein